MTKSKYEDLETPHVKKTWISKTRDFLNAGLSKVKAMFNSSVSFVVNIPAAVKSFFGSMFNTISNFFTNTRVNKTADTDIITKCNKAAAEDLAKDPDVLTYTAEDFSSEEFFVNYVKPLQESMCRAGQTAETQADDFEIQKAKLADLNDTVVDADLQHGLAEELSEDKAELEELKRMEVIYSPKPQARTNAALEGDAFPGVISQGIFAVDTTNTNNVDLNDKAPAVVASDATDIDSVDSTASTLVM